MAKIGARRIKAVAAAGALAAIPLIASCATTPSSSAGGWVVKGAPFSSVYQILAVPPVTCDGTNRRVAFDVGFDGNGAPTTERAGLVVDCARAGSVPSYSAFYAGTGIGSHVVPLTNPNPSSGIGTIKAGDTFAMMLLAQPGVAGSFGFIINDSRRLPDASTRNGHGEGTFSVKGPATSAGCLVESPLQAMPHFGAIKVSACLVGTGPLFGTTWDVSGAIKLVNPPSTKPNFSLVGYKMVRAGSNAVRVAVTSENADRTYSLIQLAP